MKAVLVIDMPKDCIKCPLSNSYCWNIFPIKGIADECPLKTLPQKKHDGLVFKSDGTAFTKEMEIGWNAYRDAITGETE